LSESATPFISLTVSLILSWPIFLFPTNIVILILVLLTNSIASFNKVFL
jgi:hypothetical protein